MRLSAPSFIASLLALSLGAAARSSTGDRVLLVVDGEEKDQFSGSGSYSKFLESLNGECTRLMHEREPDLPLLDPD